MWTHWVHNVIINLTNKVKGGWLIMTEIVWNNDGQGEFDFDYLLNLTDRDFSDLVAAFVNNCVKRNDFIKTIRVKNDESLSLDVFIVLTHGLQVFTYFHGSKKRRESFISAVDLAWALEVINNG